MKHLNASLNHIVHKFIISIKIHSKCENMKIWLNSEFDMQIKQLESQYVDIYIELSERLCPWWLVKVTLATRRLTLPASAKGSWNKLKMAGIALLQINDTYPPTTTYIRCLDILFHEMYALPENHGISLVSRLVLNQLYSSSWLYFRKR